MTNRKKAWLLEQFDMLREIPHEIIEAFEDHTSIHQSFKKEMIYLQGDPSDYVYFCKKGRIKISKVTTDGKETTLYVVQPGEMFGEMALIDENSRTHAAESLDQDALICSFPKKKFQEQLEKHPELSRRVYKQIGDRMKIIEMKLADLVFKSADERIVRFLLQMGEPHLRKEVDEAFIKPFFTHEEIAHLTATSRQTVTTVLNELKKEGLITFSRNKMYIREFGKLQAKLS